MANFIERTLEPGEKVIFKGRLHWSFNFRFSFWGIVLMIGSLIGAISVASMEEGNEDNKTIYYCICVIAACFGFLLICYGYFIRSKTEFAVTDTRFIQKDGIFNIKMTEIPLFKVETVNFYQTLFDRMIGTGSIELVGSGGTAHKVDYLQQPFQVRNLITTQMKECKKDNEVKE